MFFCPQAQRLILPRCISSLFSALGAIWETKPFGFYLCNLIFSLCSPVLYCIGYTRCQSYCHKTVLISPNATKPCTVFLMNHHHHHPLFISSPCIFHDVHSCWMLIQKALCDHCAALERNTQGTFFINLDSCGSNWMCCSAFYILTSSERRSPPCWEHTTGRYYSFFNVPGPVFNHL